MTTENKNKITEKVVEESKTTKPKTTKTRTTRTKKTTAKSKATIFKELKKNAKDIDVEVVSLVGGDVIYKSQRNDLDVILIEGVGGSTIVSLATIIDACKKTENLFSTLALAITDIMTDDYSKEDILEMLKIKDLYIFDEMVIDTFDDFILNTDKSKFETEFNKIENRVIKDRMVERSIALYREGKLDSNFKQSVLEAYAENEYLYKSI